MPNKKLSNEELNRYSRHLVLPEVGIEGQEKLKQSKVLIVGAGGLGSPVALYLAAAGLGTIGIVDFDKVEESNLQRQIIHSTKNIGNKKIHSAKEKIKDLNPNVEVILHDEKLTSKNALELIKKYDIVIDGSDNFPAKYLVNDACVLLKKPNIYGSIYRFDGHASVFNYQNGPCYRCLFPNPPPKESVPSCAQAGVLGVLPGIIGTIQATEALKIILGKGNILSDRFLTYNTLKMDFKILNLKKNKNCKICGENPTVKELIDYEKFCNAANNSNNLINNDENKDFMNKYDDKKTINGAENNLGLNDDEISVIELKNMIDKKEDFALIDVREQGEWDLCRIEGAELIPLGKFLGNNLGDLNNIGKNKKIILYCHTGRRSAVALEKLKEDGYKHLKNLVGGIDAWAREIDNDVMIY